MKQNIKMVKTAKIFTLVLVFLVLFYFIGLAFIGIQNYYDIELTTLEEQLNSEYITYGNVTEIKSFNAAGFLGSSSCLIEINNKTEPFTGSICKEMKQGSTLEFKEINSEIYGNTIFWRIKE